MNNEAMNQPEREGNESGAEASEEKSFRTMPGERERKPTGRFRVGEVILSRYNVLSELGQGGMGVVYKCFDEVSGVEVALKALPPELSHSACEMEEFRKNFQLIEKLQHSNIASVKTFEKDHTNGDCYLIMELVKGINLRYWIRQKYQEGGASASEIISILEQVANALDYAHHKGVLHRDVKPENILVAPDGESKILDFGLAAQVQTSMSRVSVAYRGASGTAPYMAPEQWKGVKQGIEADQYALAVVAYEMFSGQLPFENQDIGILREIVLHEDLPPIENQSLTIMNALRKGMARNPEDRYGCCMDFVRALKGEFKEPKAKNAQFFLMSGIGGVAILVLAGGIAYYLFANKNENPVQQGPVSNNETNIVPIRKDLDKPFSTNHPADSSITLTNVTYPENPSTNSVESNKMVSFPSDPETAKEVVVVEPSIPAVSTNFPVTPDIPKVAPQPAVNVTPPLSPVSVEKKTEVTNILVSPQVPQQTNENSIEQVKPEEPTDEDLAREQLGKTWTVPLNMESTKIKLKLEFIPAGVFMMGSPHGELGRTIQEIQHEVKITKGYWMGVHEVTQAEWNTIMGKVPSQFKGDDLPVSNISWEDAVEFCENLTKLEREANRLPKGYKYALPTEAQWEYACRAGSTLALNNDSNITTDREGEKCLNLNLVGWYFRNTSSKNSKVEPRPRAVETKSKNNWGLHDMHGNVWEWCSDWDGAYTTNFVEDPVGSEEGVNRIARGGSYQDQPKNCRSASRLYFKPDAKKPYLGFRIALVHE